MRFINRIWLSALIAVLLCGAFALAGTSPGQDDTDKVERISVDELILMMAKKKPVTIIDSRVLDSYDTKIKGALQIPVTETEARLKEIPRDREIVTYCA